MVAPAAPSDKDGSSGNGAARPPPARAPLRPRGDKPAAGPAAGRGGPLPKGGERGGRGGEREAGESEKTGQTDASVVSGLVPARGSPA